MNSPRVKFNWGYQDAVSEKLQGRLRTIVEQGQHSTTQVSRQFNEWYYQGYKAGATETDLELRNSDPAWKAFVATQDRQALYQAQLNAEISELKSTFKGMKVSKERIIQKATEYTDQVFNF